MELRLTANHSNSHYGIPVLLVRGQEYGPADILPDGRIAAEALYQAAETASTDRRRLIAAYLSQWPEGPQIVAPPAPLPNAKEARYYKICRLSPKAKEMIWERIPASVRAKCSAADLAALAGQMSAHWHDAIASCRAKVEDGAIWIDALGQLYELDDIRQLRSSEESRKGVPLVPYGGRAADQADR